MRNFISATFITSCMLLLMAGCKKENNAPSTPAPPHASGNATVNSISLNGGNPNGRWTSYLYYTVTYQNDTFQSEATDTAVAGMEIINFHPGGVATIWMDDTIFLDSSTYTINGNVLTVITSTQDTSSFQYGVNGNRMRWHSTSVQSMSPNMIRTEEDVILERY